MTAWDSLRHPRRTGAALADLRLLARDYMRTIEQLTSQVAAKEAEIKRLKRPAVRVVVAVAGKRVLDTGYVHPATTWQGAMSSPSDGYLTLTWVPKEPEVDQSQVRPPPHNHEWPANCRSGCPAYPAVPR